MTRLTRNKHVHSHYGLGFQIAQPVNSDILGEIILCSRGAVLCIKGCLVASLASTQLDARSTLPSVVTTKKYIQTLPNVLWGTKSASPHTPLVKNH